MRREPTRMSNLVAILLTFSYLAWTLESSSSVREDRGTSFLPSFGKKGSFREVNRIARNEASLNGNHTGKERLSKVQSNAVVPSWMSIESRDVPRRRRKRKMDRTLVALLMAYKMKFLALIPTLIGGFILLISTSLFAGFFFSLFAAVLGLKIH